MSNLLQLPRTAGCVVCGNENPHGLRLTSRVSVESGDVTTEFTVLPQHIGFQGIIHGGITATVLDEAMVWAATWSGKRFCLAGEITVRFRKPIAVGTLLHIKARVVSARGRIILTEGTAIDGDVVVAEATGKYMQVPIEQHHAMVATFVDEPAARQAASMLA